MSDAAESLRNVLKTIATEYDYEDDKTVIEQFSTGGANYTSHLYHITLSANGKDDLKLFAKVASVSVSVRAQMPFKIYENETYFYTKLLKQYQELEERHNVTKEHRLAAVKFYGSCEKYLHELLVLEDLEPQGFLTHNRLVSFDWEYASKAVTELAKIHALSIALFKENPEEIDNISEMLKMSMDTEQMRQMMQSMTDTVLVAVKDENRERLRSFLNSLQEVEMDHYFKVRRTPVIAHGDYRPSNLMHRSREGGEIELVALDYQMLRFSNPICDLMFLIYSGSDEQFREKYYSRLLDHYYNELSNSLARLGIDAKSTYSREDFNYELKEVQPYGLLIGILMMPMLTVEAENAPDMSESSGFEDFIIKPNNLPLKG